ncbi:MAG: 3-dehydroquinate synthase [Proteobacteria bacterium]|nr:3-dehydroquinate synthase [Alphaproteobacteria bacterium]NCC04080.1 3-dehydroquinate synthase [Pseudomonadota bacterium]
MTQIETLSLSFTTAPRGYDILIGEGVLEQAGTLISSKIGKRRCIIITDDHVGPLYAERVEASLTQAGLAFVPTITLPAGEALKCADVLNDLLEKLFEKNIDRKTLILALGGGVIGDLAGFAASIALRGLDFIQIPTSLLAQVDSSVGGKTGINSSFGKNTIGSFHQPLLVLTDVATLDTLPDRHMKAGYAEIVKYGLIRDKAFYEWCEQNGAKVIARGRAACIAAIRQSCAHKAEIVSADEKESGVRALLNLGHSFGHALEKAVGYNDALLHGEAVAIGTILAFEASVSMGLCPATDAQRVRTHFMTLGLPTTPPKTTASIEDLIAFMGQDKKALNGEMTLILQRGIGDAIIQKNVAIDPIRKVWEATC